MTKAEVQKFQVEFYLNKVKSLLSEIDQIETNDNISEFQKLAELKIIKDQINEITIEIDKIKTEIKLIKDYNLN